MTLAGVETSQDEPPAAQGSRTRSLWIVLAVVGAQVVVGLVGWQQTASRWRADVTVGFAAPLRCTGTTVHLSGGVPFVTLRPGLRCTLSLRISNSGSHSVHVDTLALPFMGPHTGAQLRAYGANQGVLSGGRDALFRIERDIPGHASFVVSYQLRYWPGGCIGQGSSETVSELPQLTVSALATSGSRDGRAIIGERGTAESEQARGCPAS